MTEWSGRLNRPGRKHSEALEEQVTVPSTHSSKPVKPSKPDPEFPLAALTAGYWSKKSRGRIHHFGPWGDPGSALQKYLERKGALHSGRKPRPDAEGLTVSYCGGTLSWKSLLHKGLRRSRRRGRLAQSTKPLEVTATVALEY